MKDITLSFTVTVALRQTDVHWVEEQLLALRQAAFLRVMEQVVGAIEAEVLARLGPCPSCGGRRVHNGRAPRRLETLLGPLEIQRARLRCLGCGADSCPLDAALGLPPGLQQTLGVRERALWAATEVSYDKSRRFLQKFTGLAVGRMTIHRMAHEEGGRLLAQDAAAREAVFAQGQEAPQATAQPRQLVIQLDGTGVRNRATRSPMESKVAVLFTGAVPVGRRRRALRGRRIVASFETAERFGESVWLEAVRQGVEQAERVVVMGDGAAWIKDLQRTHFPGALYVLDLWHLERQLRATLGAEDPEIPALLAAAGAGEPTGLLAPLRRRWLRASTAERRADLRALIQYVEANAEGIENLPRAGLWGSGPVEKQVDTIVCRRFKTRGMSWYRPGAAALQRLRVLKANGDWDSYWAARRRELAQHAA